MQSKRAKTPRSWPRALLSVIDQTCSRMVPLCDQDEIVNEAPCKPLSPRLMTEPAACSSLLSPRGAWHGPEYVQYIVVALKKIVKGLLSERIKLHHHHYVCYSVLHTSSMPGSMPFLSTIFDS